MNKCVLFVFFSDGLAQAFCFEEGVSLSMKEMVDEMIFFGLLKESEKCKK